MNADARPGVGTTLQPVPGVYGPDQRVPGNPARLGGPVEHPICILPTPGFRSCGKQILSPDGSHFADAKDDAAAATIVAALNRPVQFRDMRL